MVDGVLRILAAKEVDIYTFFNEISSRKDTLKIKNMDTIKHCA